ncbi:MAG: protein kinase [Acidobacteriia bacterium]|nr:protein kinase [Terriglobia bacterium]
MISNLSHYRLVESLGCGGMGEVFRAEDTRLQRTVALKLFSEQATPDPEQRRQLQQEARRAAAVNHRNITTIYELGEWNGDFYIVMEYVAGKTLSEEIQAGPLPLDRVLDLSIQILAALKAAHAGGIVHCDLKPSNIMLTSEGVVKILDFGLSRQTPTRERRLSPDDLTSGVEALENSPLRGTPDYLSPEQIRGELPNERSDIFSFGVLLFEMVAGRRPFEAPGPAALLRKILHEEPGSLCSFRPDLPLELEHIVRKALHKSPDRRYASAAEVSRDLEKLQGQLDWKYLSRNGVDSVHELPLPELPAAHPSLFSRWLKALLLGSMLLGAATASLMPLYRNWGVWIAVVSIFGIVATLTIERVRQHRSKDEPVAGAAGAAFRGLLPFHESDNGRFYGREIDVLTLLDRMSHTDYYFGVLFGDSGCGKTSLIRAGLIPRLWKTGFLPLYCRSYKDPLRAIGDECQRRTGEGRKNSEEVDSYLSRVSKTLDAPLVLLFDQFEEFFVAYKSPQAREPFVAFVQRCQTAAAGSIKILFSLRSDFLHLISTAFTDRVPEPLGASRLYHLQNFGVMQAAEVIDRSARRADLPFEDGLGQHVAHDLAENGAVLPSELQIVGEQLQRKRIFTNSDYLRAGGEEQLLHGYLEDVIQMVGDRDTAQLLLRCLISDENTRLTLPLDEIARRTQRPAAEIKSILEAFVAARLIHEVQEEEPWRYELMHEYLIERINRVTGKMMDAAQRANRLFRRYFSEYQVDSRTRIPLTKLWSIRRYADHIWNAREQKLVRQSWRRGVLNVTGLFIVFLVLAVTATSFFSINESWEGTRLTDGHTAAVRRAVFTPDGQRLISCGEDGKVIVWDFVHRQRVATLTAHRGWVTTCAVSPDGRWIATGGLDQRVIVWNAGDFRQVAELSRPGGEVAAVSFSEDGRKLGAIAKRTVVWEVGSWKEIAAYPLGVGYGSMLFSARGDQVLYPAGAVWDIPQNRLLQEFSKPGMNWATMSRDQRHLLSIDSVGAVAFWNLDKPGMFLPRHVTDLYQVHRDHGRATAYSPDGRLAATGAEDIVLWDAVHHTKLARLEHAAIVWSLTFSPDGRWLVSTHGDGAILIWDVSERGLAANLNEHSGAVRAVSFSNQGRWIASAGDDGSIILWDAASLKKASVLLGHQTRVTALSFSSDDTWLASCDQDGVVILWDLKSGQASETFRYRDSSGGVSASYAVAVSPDGRWVASTNCIYDPRTQRCVLDLTNKPELDRGHIYGMDFTDDGRLFVCVTDQGTVGLADAQTWKILGRTQLKGMQLIAVSFSPDGKQFVTVEDSGLVRLWSVSPLRELGVLGRHTARVKAVSFSPDGREVSSAGDDGMIAVWSVRRRSLITRIGTPHAPVLAVAYSPDGRRLVTGGSDRSVFLFTRQRWLWGHRLD